MTLKCLVFDVIMLHTVGLWIAYHSPFFHEIFFRTVKFSDGWAFTFLCYSDLHNIFITVVTSNYAIF